MNGPPGFRLFLAAICILWSGTLLSAERGDVPTPAEMAARVDALLETRWREEGIEPAAAASDAEFLRRAHLDFAGAVPRVAEARAFLRADPQLGESPEPSAARDDRDRLIDKLVDSPAFATHLATRWRQTMLPGGIDAEQIQGAAQMESWFRRQLVDNLRYDRLVAEFLVAGGAADGPAVFYTANELAPEKLAAQVSRVFLGVQIECAQCHDHPFDRWLQTDFWGMAAFFARVRGGEPSGPQMTARIEDAAAGEVMLPETERVVPPTFLGGREAREGEGGTRRVQLAIWMASRDNPYLAQAAVNRAWAHLFGRGIVEPLDDFGSHNPPSQPELLDALANYFVATGFDLKELYRMLGRTRAYRLTSRASAKVADSAAGRGREARFARMAIKPLSPEQLYDSLNRVLLRRQEGMGPVDSARPNSPLLDPRRQAFLVKMQLPSRSAVEFEAGVPQALTLMNGDEAAEAADPQAGGLLAALDAPFLTDEERVETLFLATLSRLPRDEEREVTVAYVTRRSHPPDRRAALSDVLWALLNTAEFAVNH